MTNTADGAAGGAPHPARFSTRRAGRLRVLRSVAAVVLLTSIGALQACAEQQPPQEARTSPVSKQAFFFYSCVQEYLRVHAIPLFDGSVAYAVENSDLSAETLSEVHGAAAAAARRIRAPDYSDPEHGLPAVLVVCQQEAANAVPDRR